MYSGAVRVKIRQANRIAGAVNSKLPCFLYSKYAVPTLTKNRIARIISTTGNTTLLTTSLTCPCDVAGSECGCRKQRADKGDDHNAEQDFDAFSFHVEVPPKIFSSFVFFI